MTEPVSACSPVNPRPRRFSFLATVSLMLVLAGCGVRPAAPGIEAGGVDRYGHITFVPLIADEVRLVWRDGATREAGERQRVGWKTQLNAGQIASELLREAGTPVTAIEDVKGALLGSDEDTLWETRVWRRLKATGRLDPRGAVIVLRQNALDAQGRQYNPARVFLALGLVGVVIGAATRDDAFQPSFILAINTGFQAALGGKSRCSIGFDARLLDAKSGAILGSVDAVLGQELFPVEIENKKWPEFSADERGLAKTYCTAALRRGIAQAMSELEITRRR